MEPRRNLFTIGQAAEYLGVSIDTLRRWEKKGRVEAFRSPGGHRYYERDDLDKLFGKKYVHEEKPLKEEIEKPEPVVKQVVTEELPEPPVSVPVEPAPYIPPEPIIEIQPPTPPIPSRIITIPEVAPIQIARKIEEPVESTHPIVYPPQIPVPNVQNNVPIPSPDRSFLVPQLSPLKEPVRNERSVISHPQSKGNSKETIQVIIIITVLALVIILAIILVIMMVKSSQSVLSPSP